MILIRKLDKMIKLDSRWREKLSRIADTTQIYISQFQRCCFNCREYFLFLTRPDYIWHTVCNYHTNTTNYPGAPGGTKIFLWIIEFISSGRYLSWSRPGLDWGAVRVVLTEINDPHSPLFTLTSSPLMAPWCWSQLGSWTYINTTHQPPGNTQWKGPTLSISISE